MTIWDQTLQTLPGVSSSAKANSTVHTSICKFSPPAHLPPCKSANQKHLCKRDTITVQFSRGRLMAQVLVLERGSVNSDGAPNIARASGVTWVAQLCALSHQRDGQTHVQKHNCHCPEQAWSEITSQNRLRSVILTSYGNLRRNGDCPHEGKQVHRSTFSKSGCMVRQARLPILGFQTQSCLPVACLHSLLGLCAMMLLFQAKNCVKLAAQEMKALLNSYQTSYRDETCRNICPITKIQAVLSADKNQTLKQRP